MTPPSVEVVRLGEQVSEGLDVASRNSRTMLDGERSIEAREALGRLLAEIDALNAELARQQDLWTVQAGTIRGLATERDGLRKALERVQIEELNGRLCARPESADDRCCDNCRETWRLVDEALSRAAVSQPHNGETT